ncbi:CKS1 protein [Gonium pectorale]|uniref:CKS1 protein n=1 Tax=Gonium pectorale TaxID=33097 RepID=A0A150GK19_GONPE|nr:CKS1 protein [Gonium pectorale]|eukprot:KXZ50173.1 CKS1 protein [Gonium pectorale]
MIDDEQLWSAAENAAAISGSGIAYPWNDIGDATAAGLLQLYIHAAHMTRPGVGAGGAHAEAYTQLRSTLAKVVCKLCIPGSGHIRADFRRYLTIASALVKSHTLRCYSAIAAEAAVAALEGVGGATRAALRLLHENIQLLRGILGVASKAGFEGVAELRQELEAEFVASGAVEHCVRLLLALTESPQSNAWLARMVQAVDDVFADLSDLCHIIFPGLLGRLLPTSRSLSFYLSCQLVTGCAELGRGGAAASVLSAATPRTACRCSTSRRQGAMLCPRSDW